MLCQVTLVHTRQRGSPVQQQNACLARQLPASRGILPVDCDVTEGWRRLLQMRADYRLLSLVAEVLQAECAARQCAGEASGYVDDGVTTFLSQNTYEWRKAPHSACGMLHIVHVAPPLVLASYSSGRSILLVQAILMLAQMVHCLWSRPRRFTAQVLQLGMQYI